MVCYRCGGKHKAADCKFQEADCHFCKKRATFPRFTKTNKGSRSPRIHQLLDGTTDNVVSDEYSLYHTQGQDTTPILVALQVNGKDLTMELDTRATVSIVSEKLTKICFRHMQHHN